MADRLLLRPAILTSLVLALACGDDHATAPVVTGDLSEEWQTASPASQGLDPVGITAAVAHARTLPRLLSLLVVRNGALVVEQYFNGNHADSLNDGRSVTKSVVSTLVGAGAACAVCNAMKSGRNHITGHLSDPSSSHRSAV